MIMRMMAMSEMMMIIARIGIGVQCHSFLSFAILSVICKKDIICFLSFSGTRGSLPHFGGYFSLCVFLSVHVFGFTSFRNGHLNIVLHILHPICVSLLCKILSLCLCAFLRWLPQHCTDPRPTLVGTHSHPSPSRESLSCKGDDCSCYHSDYIIVALLIICFWYLGRVSGIILSMLLFYSVRLKYKSILELTYPT